MIIKIDDNLIKIYTSYAKYYVTETNYRYEINSEADEINDRLRDIQLLYQWLRSVADGVLRRQVRIADAGAETIYIFKKPAKVVLERELLGIL